MPTQKGHVGIHQMVVSQRSVVPSEAGGDPVQKGRSPVDHDAKARCPRPKAEVAVLTAEEIDRVKETNLFTDLLSNQHAVGWE